MYTCEQQRLWRDCADAQARLSLRWSPMWQEPYSHELAQLAFCPYCVVICFCAFNLYLIYLSHVMIWVGFRSVWRFIETIPWALQRFYFHGIHAYACLSDNIYIFIAIASDGTIILVTVHFARQNIYQSRDLDRALAGATSTSANNVLCLLTIQVRWSSIAMTLSAGVPPF